MLHAVVVVRKTVDCRVPLPANPYGEKPLAESLVSIVNPSDWTAFEQAVLLKQQGRINKITVLHLGSLDGEETLRWCLAAGADAVLRIWDPALDEADQLGRGKTLAAALQRLKVGLVFCGDRCLDQFNSLMPGIAAGLSKIAYVTEIEKVEKVTYGHAIVICRREKGKREKIEVRFPALLAINETCMISSERADLTRTLNAFTQEIPCWNLRDLGLAAEGVGGRAAKIAVIQTLPYQPPLTKPLTPDYRLPAEQRLRAIITGGTMRKQGEVVAGEPEKLAERMRDFLLREPVLRL